MKLKDALDIRPGEVVSLVGGGGKTTVMFALARELAEANDGCVITTTTTKIWETEAKTSPLLIQDNDEDRLLARFREAARQYQHITLARERLSSGKLAGISPELVARLASSEETSHIIIEADGAAGRPIKAPNATEPVIPEVTTLVIAVIGVEAADSALNETDVFRAKIAAELLGQPLDTALSVEAVATLLTHPQGITKGSPAHARIIPFINKVDPAGGRNQGRQLAQAILAMRHPAIGRVLLGQAQHEEPVIEIINAGVIV